MLPNWLADQIPHVVEDCRAAASTSRKRVASVKPRPEFIGPDRVRHVVAPVLGERRDGEQPNVWAPIRRLLFS